MFEQGTEGAIDFSQLLNVEIEVDRLALLVEELLLQRFLFTLFGLQINELIVPDKPPSSSNDECEQADQDGYFRYERPATRIIRVHETEVIRDRIEIDRRQGEGFSVHFCTFPSSGLTRVITKFMPNS